MSATLRRPGRPAFRRDSGSASSVPGDPADPATREHGPRGRSALLEGLPEVVQEPEVLLLDQQVADPDGRGEPR